MGITARTRKRLWTRAGNCCALCKCLLVQRQNVATDDVILGDEAHIVSRKPKGPRHRDLPRTAFDAYENLILLCRSDHTRVDAETDFYTEDVLREAKKQHEEWIEKTIVHSMGGKRSLSEALNDSVLQRLRNGTAVVNLMSGTLANSWGWKPLASEVQAELAGTFADFLNEISDILTHLSFEYQATTEVVITKRIAEMEKAGLFLYGKKLSLMTDVPGGQEELLTAVFRLSDADHDVFIDLGLVPREMLLA